MPSDLVERLSRKARPAAWRELDRARTLGRPSADAAEEVAAGMLAGDERLVLAMLAHLFEAAAWAVDGATLRGTPGDEFRRLVGLSVQAVARELGVAPPDADEGAPP